MMIMVTKTTKTKETHNNNYNNAFSNSAQNSHCTIITDMDTSKQRKPSPAATPSWKLVPRPRNKHEVRTADRAWENWIISAADSACYASVG
jgi:hypothetical protein